MSHDSPPPPRPADAVLVEYDGMSDGCDRPGCNADGAWLLLAAEVNDENALAYGEQDATPLRACNRHVGHFLAGLLT